MNIEKKVLYNSICDQEEYESVKLKKNIATIFIAEVNFPVALKCADELNFYLMNKERIFRARVVRET